MGKGPFVGEYCYVAQICHPPALASQILRWHDIYHHIQLSVIITCISLIVKDVEHFSIFLVIYISFIFNSYPSLTAWIINTFVIWFCIPCIPWILVFLSDEYLAKIFPILYVLSSLCCIFPSCAKKKKFKFRQFSYQVFLFFLVLSSLQKIPS